MCTNEETLAAGHSIDPTRWKEAFDGLMGRLAGRFARVEPRRRAARLVLGLLSDLPRKNCWTIAEWTGEANPNAQLGHFIPDNRDRVLDAWRASVTSVHRHYRAP